MDQSERRACDDIHVAEEQDRLAGVGGGDSAEADDEVHFARVRAEQTDVFSGKASVEKALLHGCRAEGDVALRRVRSVDLDELLEDFAGFCALGGRCRRELRLRRGGRDEAECERGDVAVKSDSAHGWIVRCAGV